ncbi:3'(2'),5'-bisphosphate nucleotidase CysQ [Terricaulis silvestris]|uniref:3'(2'),5'-bisphosphate nucleotidase CysQ n=1 Tax=Terricaulis silvestris TaxID=2686094 RepID=A0A6I6ML89_9CAUL|nr:3'(2'),5'-bisphosphate nucleotidase CysQ [Terricaulis silvestris]QGZ96145.1 3'(2'),5'-bisphosphate nucleotidase CysQ [Terricaulis silvestris]
MLDKLVDIALEAGAAIMRIYASETVAARSKDDGSPVTEADATAEAIILARLHELNPETPIIAEEEASAGRAPIAAARFFLVDPLDGTKEFLSRNGDFTVNIALIENNRPVCGVVYAPAHGVIYAGAEGDGARKAIVAEGAALDWRPIEARNPPQAGLAVVASRSHMSEETHAFVGRFSVANLVPAGSSLKFCRVASGEADLYPRLGRTMEWDTAAGDAVLRAAGGQVCTMDGQLLRYGKRLQASDVDYANPWFVAAGRFNPFQA